MGMASSEENANCVTADTIDAYAMTAPAMASNIRAEASAVGGVAEPANRTDTGAPASFSFSPRRRRTQRDGSESEGSIEKVSMRQRCSVARASAFSTGTRASASVGMLPDIS